jgi:hypothetical protein
MVERSSALVVGAMLVLGGFTGCLAGQEDVAEASGPLVRTTEVDLTVEPGMAGPSNLEDVVETTYTYKHQDGEAEAAEVTVTYQGVDGAERTQPLSTFADQATLAPGDRIEIGPVHPTSHARIEHDGEVVAERGTEDHDWLTAGGAPLPVAVQPGGSLQQSVESTTSLDVQASDVNVGYVENGTESEERIDQAEAMFDLDRSLELSMEAPSEGGQLAIDLQMSGAPSVFASVTGSNESGEVEAGVDAGAEWTTSPTLDLTLSGNELQTIASEGTMRVDGDVTVWNPEHPREEEWTPEAFREDPWLEESFDSEEGPIEAEQTPAKTADRIRDLWNMDLAVGDELRVQAEASEDGRSIETESVAQVLGTDDRELPSGETVETFRIEQTADVTVQDDGAEPIWEKAQQNRIWIAQDSYLPVHQQVRASEQIDRDELADLLEEAADEEEGEEAEKMRRLAEQLREGEFELTFETETSMTLEDHEPGIRFASPMGLGIGLQMLAFGAVDPAIGALAEGNPFMQGFGNSGGFAGEESEGPERASASAKMVDMDEDDPWIRVALTSGENAPYAEEDVRVTTADADYRMHDRVCETPQLDGYPACEDPFEQGESWEVGQSLFVPCSGEGSHQVDATVKETRVLEKQLECPSGSR